MILLMVAFGLTSIQDPEKSKAALPHVDKARKLSNEATFSFGKDREKKMAEAVREFDEALRIDPSWTFVRMERGQAHLALKNWDKAIEDFTAFLQKFTDLKVWRSDRIRCLSARGMAYSGKKDYLRALGDFNEALKLDPKNADLLCDRGHAFQDAKQLDAAIDDYTRAILINPKSHFFRHFRAAAYVDLGRYQEAIADYKEAERLGDKTARSAMGRLEELIALRSAAAKHIEAGESAFERGKVEEAVQHYTKAIEADPRNPKAWAYRGDCFYSLKDYKKAVADFDRAIELDPRSAAYFLWRGDAYLALQDVRSAYRDFSEGVKLDPKSAQGHFCLGLCLATNGEYETSISHFNRAIELKPDHAGAWLQRGYAHRELQKWSECVRDLEEAIRRDPKLKEPAGPYLEEARKKVGGK